MHLNTPAQTTVSARTQPQIGVAFLARGLHPDWQQAFQRFVNSYNRFPAGIPHRLYVIFKGYRDAAHLAEGQTYFVKLPHVAIYTDDAGFDIGCYKQAATQMEQEFVCFLNTKSEILCPNWLRKLAQHVVKPGVGVAANTGSYESLHFKVPAIPPFPNPHIRTNGFLIRRELFLRIAAGFEFRTKEDGWLFESGPNGLSRQLERMGLQRLVVDRAGNAFEPERWPAANTYRSATATPIIGDDTSRRYRKADATFQRNEAAITWGTPREEAEVRELYGHASDAASRIVTAGA